MSDANFRITDVIAESLRKTLDAQGVDHLEILVNPDGAEDMDAVDDEIQFRTSDGATSPFRIQSGPYGIGINEDIHENGEFVGVRHHAEFEQFEHERLVARIMTMIDVIAPRSDAPKP